MKRPSHQSGNVLFIILIAVALFAALSFALTQNHGGSSNATIAEQRSLAAGEIIEFANGLRGGLDHMTLLANVADGNIRFSASTANAGYGTPGASPQNEVFNAAGGGATYQEAPQSACISTCAYEFSGQYTLGGVGSDDRAELVTVLTGIEASTCQRINQLLNNGYTSPPSGPALSLTRFTGTYTDGAGVFINTSGRRALCYRESSGSGRYIFVSVIHPR